MSEQISGDPAPTASAGADAVANATSGPDAAGAADVRAGVQSAVLEAIAAARKLLDVAESAVRDPAAVGQVLGTLGSLAKLAVSALAANAQAPGAATPAPTAAPPSAMEDIPLS